MTFDDPNVYEMISRGETDAIFQLESSGIDAIYARSWKPETFEDIICGHLRLFRPGAYGSDSAIRRGASRPE